MTAGITGNTHGSALNCPIPPWESVLDLLPASLTKLYSIWVSLTFPFASRGRGLSVHYTCDWLRSRAHRIRLGNSVQIMKGAIIDVVAPPGQTGEPLIVIDDNSQIGYRCFVCARKCIHIERDVIMAQSVLIADHGYAHHDGILPNREQDVTEGGRIRIGQGSWIGHGAAIVCTGSELVLGRNCVVAANAVVTRSYPSHSVVFGNPARVIRQFDLAKNVWVLGPVQPPEAETAK